MVIWSNIVGVALRIVAFSVQVDRNDQSCWRLTVGREIFNHRMRRLTPLAADAIWRCDDKVVALEHAHFVGYSGVGKLRGLLAMPDQDQSSA